MVDVVSREKRSSMMSGIKGKNTMPEMLVRRFLHRKGLRFRLHVASLTGKPDLVFPKYRVAVQVHGCFWHQHVGCKFAYMPKSNRAFWRAKLAANVERDARTNIVLRAAGWRVITVWECEASKDVRLRRLARMIREET